MKSLLIFASVLVLCFAQPNPKPMPSINVDRLNGTWYIGLAFNSTFNTQNPLGITCWTWNLTIDDNAGQVDVLQNYVKGGSTVSDTFTFNVSTNGSSFWTDPWGNEWVWVDIDIRDYKWGALAGDTQQYALFLFRNANYSQNIAHDEIEILSWENYVISTDNSYFIDNTNCTSIII
jgi:hypothetical protein